MRRFLPAFHRARHTPTIRAHGFVALLLLGVAACLTGCGSTPEAGGGGGAVVPLDADAVIAGYNARASRVTSLWARVAVVLEGKDAEGSALRERAEGHLQIVPPTDVAITLGKLGETNLYFGSNDRLYWWFDMTDSAMKVARFGRHALVTPEKIDRLGLPIHPLDLVEALGITPIDATGAEVVPGDEPGTFVITAPSRRGLRRVTISGDRFEPSNIELLSPGGEVLLDVELSRYRLLAGLDPGEVPLRVAERVRVRMAGFDGEIRLTLHEPTRRAIKPIAFDPAKLADVYGVHALYDLDEPAGEPGS
ncbi:MAG TPA: hypothetical protein ENK11_02335 [Phycisphaerales bacterium]|nr:hypothetical protein [Phycisphaerales bacterium]